jgi:hypothetical protein
LHEIRLQISGPDWRVQFKDAAGEFFNPHDLAHLGKDGQFRLCFEAGIIAPAAGHWEVIFSG